MADTDTAVGLGGEKEGRRLRALRECFHRALKLALECPAWEEFAACFTDLPEHYTVALFDLYQQAEFEDICEEAQIWTKLHDLEQLCQEQGLLDGCDNSTRPTNRIAPAAAAQTYRVQAKQQEKLELEGILEQMQEQRAELEASLQQKQLEVMQAADQFQPVTTNLEKMALSDIMTVVKFPQHVASLGIDQLFTDSAINGELLASDEA
ncbi:MAG: hypothetical protein FRX49_03052 [Trebouxia sp. A1-2]|nr:MAG: hypothetical protein FRX49_03052 [Trebouxia sp. A1-2]